MLNNEHGSTVAEVGCSDGHSLMFLKRNFGFSRAVGLDIAIQRPETVNGVEFLPANFNEELPLEEGSTDVFIAMMVIEHLFDPFHAFREIKRVLSPVGFAAVNLPLVTGIKNRLRLVLGQLPETSVGFERWLTDEEWDGNHLHYFSLSSIHALASKTGLRVGEISAVGRGYRLKELFPSLLASEITFKLSHK
jgi:SAM-dependent methyltransferase